MRVNLLPLDLQLAGALGQPAARWPVFTVSNLTGAGIDAIDAWQHQIDNEEFEPVDLAGGHQIFSGIKAPRLASARLQILAQEIHEVDVIIDDAGRGGKSG